MFSRLKILLIISILVNLAVLRVYAVYSCSAVFGPSSTDEYGRHVIPAIMDLKDGQVIPQELIETVDSKVLGEALVARLAMKRSEPDLSSGSKLERTSYDPITQAEIQLWFGERTLDQKETSGILNQHQTGTSRPAAGYFPELRAAIEDRLVGVQIEENYSKDKKNSKAHFLRPKYANHVVKLAQGYLFYSNANGFGPICAVLKDAVKRRATVTYTDSSERRLNMKSEVRPFLEKYLYYSKSSFFHEVQIWGAVDYRDIKEFRVTNEISFEALEKLKKTGIPIYEVNGTADKKLIYSGDQ